LDKENEKKQKMFILMKNHERDIVNLAKDTDQFKEMMEDK
jgi:hypothetical protein